MYSNFVPDLDRVRAKQPQEKAVEQFDFKVTDFRLGGRTRDGKVNGFTMCMSTAVGDRLMKCLNTDRLTVTIKGIDVFVEKDPNGNTLTIDDHPKQGRTYYRHQQVLPRIPRWLRSIRDMMKGDNWELVHYNDQRFHFRYIGIVPVRKKAEPSVESVKEVLSDILDAEPPAPRIEEMERRVDVIAAGVNIKLEGCGLKYQGNISLALASQLLGLITR